MRFTITQLTKHLISDYNCQYRRWRRLSRLQIEQSPPVASGVKFYQFRFSPPHLTSTVVFNGSSAYFLTQIYHFLLQYIPVIQFDFIRLILAGVNNSNLHSIFLNTSYLQLNFSIANFTSEKSIRPFLTVFITKFTSATRFLPFFRCSALSGCSVSPIFYCGQEGHPASPITTHKFISGHKRSDATSRR